MKSIRRNHYNVLLLLILLSVGYLTAVVYTDVVLQFDVLRSDAIGYWRASLDWPAPFNDLYHVPGYPFLIAFLRMLSFKKFSPLFLMRSINIIALLICAITIYYAIKTVNISQNGALIGGFLFVLWPFVGLSHSIYPVADAPAMAFLLTGLFALLNSYTRSAAFLFGIALITHKGTWLFVISFILTYILINRTKIKQETGKNIISLFILILPFYVVWVIGSFLHGSAGWMIAKSISVGSETRSTLLFLEGIIGTIAKGGSKGLIKGGIVLSVLTLTVIVLFLNLRMKPIYYQYGIAICTTIIFFFLYFTRVEIWAAVRFSRPLVLPLMWLGERYFQKNNTWPYHLVVWLFLLGLFGTQLAFLWYMARIYYVNFN